MLRRMNRRQFLHTVPVALASASGAFGAITSFASFMPGWGGGSLQYQDSKFGAAYDDKAAKRSWAHMADFFEETLGA